MPVIRTFVTKVKPGRLDDALGQISAFKRVFLDSGALHFGAYNVLTGPHFPGMIISAAFENYAAYAESREKVVRHPEGGVAVFAADAPQQIVHAIFEEPVYRAGGDDAGDWLKRTRVRVGHVLNPSLGRTEDLIQRTSRLADTSVECGALACAVRQIIGGDKPTFIVAAYHAGFAEFEAARSAILETDLWNEVMRSQDDILSVGMVRVQEKIDM